MRRGAIRIKTRCSSECQSCARLSGRGPRARIPPRSKMETGFPVAVASASIEMLSPVTTISSASARKPR
jgi:hypothetical protein